MSTALYRLGRTAARRPWLVIGVWMIAAVAVIGASSSFGRELEDSFEVPGLDSQQALELLRVGVFFVDTLSHRHGVAGDGNAKHALRLISRVTATCGAM